MRSVDQVLGMSTMQETPRNPSGLVGSRSSSPGWAPSEIYHEHFDTIKGLDVWRDMFLSELRHAFHGFVDRRWAPRNAVLSLDQGKRYVADGYDWLCTELLIVTDH